MEITRSVTDGYEIIGLKGDLDLNNAMEVKALLDGEMKKAPKTLILDLSGLTYIDSTGIGILINAMKTLKTAGGSLVLLALPPPVHAVFVKTNLLKFFTVVQTREDLGSALKGI